MICLGGRFRPQDDSIFEKWQFGRGKHLPGPRNCPPVACQVVLLRHQSCDRFVSSSRNERVRRPVSRVLSSPFRADRKSTRLNSSHMSISYAVFCLKKKKTD